VKPGILADVHEDVDHLRRALAVLNTAGVDRFVFLGDVCRLCERLDETVSLLAEVDAEGVWGNHDFGLCINSPEFRGQYSDATVDYMARLKPRHEIEGCLFTHIEPWLDPEKLEDLWWFEGPPETPERAAQSFAAVPHRVMFVGHFHRWFVLSREGRMGWRGEEPITLSPSARHLVGINAICDGWCAQFDTQTLRLTPYDLWPEREQMPSPEGACDSALT
jgi:Calcineurin-like phosphoesterase superfamily domain